MTDGYRLISGRSQDRNLLPGSGRLGLNRATNHPFHFNRFAEAGRQLLRDAKLAFNRCGAGAARKAHNLEVTGSKPVAGIRSARP